MRTSVRPASRPNCIRSLSALKRRAKETLELFRTCKDMGFTHLNKLNDITEEIVMLEASILEQEVE